MLLVTFDFPWQPLKGEWREGFSMLISKQDFLILLRVLSIQWSSVVEVQDCHTLSLDFLGFLEYLVLSRDVLRASVTGIYPESKGVLVYVSRNVPSLCPKISSLGGTIPFFPNIAFFWYLS